MFELACHLPPEALAALLHNFLALTGAWLALWGTLVVAALCLPRRVRRSRSTLI